VRLHRLGNKLLDLFEAILLAPDSSDFGLGPVRQSHERDIFRGGGGIRHPKEMLYAASTTPYMESVYGGRTGRLVVRQVGLSINTRGHHPAL
jgi:hypothetical protein